MADLVIRNGSVVDGSGGPPRMADVAINDGVVVEVGDVTGRGRREIDADGQLVVPGWVDIHTHYDGQATWDPEMTPSSWHGVTTAVFGNCGVGFAPVQPGTEDYLINLMEGVEDIPGTVLAEGMDFCWTSYPEYLDTLERMPRVMDIGSQLPHGALRFFVMGERGADHAEVPSPDELERIESLVAEALNAGALGFTTSRTTKHKAADGRLTPSLSAGDPELAAVARGMRAAGAGVLQVNSDFGPGEFAHLRAAAELSGRPLSVLLLQVDRSPELWRETLADIRSANAAGIAANGQVGCRPISVLLGLDVSVNPFGNHRAYRDIAHLPTPERARRLRNDEALRSALVNDRPADAFSKWMDYALTRASELGKVPDYEPDPRDTVAARAAELGVSGWQLALDLLSEGDGGGLLLFPFENYTGGSLDVIREMLADQHTICGIGDAGAHVGTICDASYPTYLLTHWARDRTRGEGLPLEFLVHKQTRGNALAYGLADRGLLAPGFRADINIVDFDALGLDRPKLVYDLPTGGKRLVQRSSGYRHTLVAGVEVSSDGEFTGERPGRLVRGAQPDPLRG
ncbi:N-acyl-D-amino-acid deacylase family protein [Candidatus Poriferisodalis sp.]|uniref:N-acyl-D-amino-acid deacylase family protein n=1 Tax=Candidatus Poriferisodalis sp. TaxID=3101277 RepID=UPI003B0238C7